MNSTEDSFIREVDEELRRDNMASLWNRYGRVAIGAIVAGLLAFGGYLYWQHRQRVAGEAEGERLEKAIALAEQGKMDEATKSFEAMKASKIPGYRASALLTRAAIALDKNDLKGAVTLYGQVATDPEVPKPWRDLALVRQSAAEFDTAKPELIIARLEPLVVKGGAWHGSAGEMVAISYLKANKRDKARAIFAGMAKDETIPESIRGRAVQVAGVLGADVVNPTSEVKTR